MSNPDYEVSMDKARIDREFVHGYLSRSYWAKNIPRQVVDKAIDNSLCVGVYSGSEQVGFGRVVTDSATFAYLSDFFVIEAHRGRGVSKLLVAAVRAHPELQGLRRWLLATVDAHGLYRGFGFSPLAHPEQYLEIVDGNVYAPSGSER